MSLPGAARAPQLRLFRPPAPPSAPAGRRAPEQTLGRPAAPRRGGGVRSERPAGAQPAARGRARHVAFGLRLRRHAQVGGGGGAWQAREIRTGSEVSERLPEWLFGASRSPRQEDAVLGDAAGRASGPHCGRLRSLSPCCQATLFILVLTFGFQLTGISRNAEELVVTLWGAGFLSVLNKGCWLSCGVAAFGR